MLVKIFCLFIGAVSVSMVYHQPTSIYELCYFTGRTCSYNFIIITSYNKHRALNILN